MPAKLASARVGLRKISFFLVSLARFSSELGAIFAVLRSLHDVEPQGVFSSAGNAASQCFQLLALGFLELP